MPETGAGIQTAGRVTVVGFVIGFVIGDPPELGALRRACEVPAMAGAAAIAVTATAIAMLLACNVKPPEKNSYAFLSATPAAFLSGLL